MNPKRFLFVVAQNLKEEQGCKVVIALTHMRTPNDLRLAQEVEEIDLILGGHDHVAEFIEVVPGEKIDRRTLHYPRLYSSLFSLIERLKHAT